MIGMRRTRKENAMAKNLLLEYSEELATKCELLCKSISGNSNTVFQLRKSSSSGLPTLPRLNILKALPICFQNSKLREKSVLKQSLGSNYSLIQKLSTKRPSKHIVTFAAGYRECLLHLVSRLKRKLITNNFLKLIWTYDFLSV